MIIYLLVLFLILFAVYDVDIKKRVKDKDPLFIIILFALILVTGLQWRMGGDNLFYEEYYKDIPTFENLRIDELQLGIRLQPLWYVFCSLLKSVTDSFVFFHIIHSIIINTIILVFIKRNTDYVFTTVLFYVLSFNYFYFNIEIQRESLAVVCFLCGLKYLKSFCVSNVIKYYVFAIIAFLFHASAVFCLLIPLFSFLLRRAKSFLQALIMLLGMLVILIIISQSFTSITGLSGVEGEVFSQAEYYFMLDKNFQNILINAIFEVMPIVIVLYLVFSKKNQFVIDLSLLSIVMILFVVNLGSAYFTGLSRIENYLIIPFFVVLSDTLYNIKGKKYLKQLCLCLLLVSFIYQETRPVSFLRKGDKHYNMYIPYRSVFDE